MQGGALDYSVVTSTGAPRFTSGTVSQGVWTHIAMTYDGTMLRSYKNGLLTGELAGSGPIQPFPVLGTTIGDNNGGGDQLHGAIDSLRIWRTARSDAQICAAAGC